MKGLSEDEKRKNVNKAYEMLKMGKSMREISSDFSIDKKTLKSWINQYLQKQKLDELTEMGVFSVGRKLKKGNTRREKSKKEVDVEVLSRKIAELGKRGIRPENIQSIFEKMQESKSTSIQEMTFIDKLLELLNIVDERNNGVDETSTGYISIADLVDMINRSPKLMTLDTNRKLQRILENIDKKASFTKEETNEVIKRTPKILNIGYSRLDNYLDILNRFEISRDGRTRENLSQYSLKNGSGILMVNPKKLLRRLSYLGSLRWKYN